MSSAARSSRPSFISGEFEVVRYAEFLAKEYAKALAQAIKESTKEETIALQERAKNSKTDWAKVSDSLKVTYNESTGTVDYGITDNDEKARLATDLEYGVPTKVAPQPLLRSQVLGNQTELSNKIANKVHAKLTAKYR
jgi:hypothetical protein